MSNHSSSGKPIPQGILVASKAAKKAERPAPQRANDRSARPIPWMWIATGGSIAWVVIVVVIALLTISQEQAQEQARPGPKPLAVDGGFAEAPVKARPVASIKDVILTPPEVDSDGKPYVIVLPDVAAPTPAQRAVPIQVETDLNATGVAITFEIGSGSVALDTITNGSSSKFWKQSAYVPRTLLVAIRIS